MKEISVNPLKFGTKEDFRKALTELRYLEKVQRRLKEDDFYRVAQKYQFPPSFLKEGIKGLSFPDDYMISKSKWFPIFYRWRAHEEELDRKLMLLMTRYIRASFFSMIVPVSIIIVALQIAFYMHQYAEQTVLEILSWLLLPVVLLILELYWELRARVGESKQILDEHTENMIRQGMNESVETIKSFVHKHYQMVLFAGHILVSRPWITLFHLGAAKSKEPKRPKLGRFQRIMIALHLLPQPKTAQIEATIPIFYAENPHLDYVNRLSKLLDLERWTEESSS